MLLLTGILLGECPRVPGGSSPSLPGLGGVVHSPFSDVKGLLAAPPGLPGFPRRGRGISAVGRRIACSSFRVVLPVFRGFCGGSQAFGGGLLHFLDLGARAGEYRIAVVGCSCILLSRGDNSLFLNFFLFGWLVCSSVDMGKHTRKSRHRERSSSSDSTSSPSPARSRRRKDCGDARLKRLIRETLCEMGGDGARSKGSVPVSSFSSGDEAEGLGDSEHKGKYIDRDMLAGLLRHVKSNMGFPDDEAPSTSGGPLLRQFQSSSAVDVPVHPFIRDVLQREWVDPDRILLPRFMAKLYPLHDMAVELPDSIPIDSFVASLVGRTSLAEDAVLKDPVDKKVDSSLKKVYSGSHLALRAGIYGTYVSQSLLSDIKSLYQSMDDATDCSSLLEHIERQVEFLSDVSFDVVRASALSSGACVAARRNLVLRDWKTDSAQKACALRLPFKGTMLFGEELEDKLHKLFKEKKHSSSFKQSSAVSVSSKPKSFFRPSSRKVFSGSRGRFSSGRGRDRKAKSPPAKPRS